MLSEAEGNEGEGEEERRDEWIDEQNAEQRKALRVCGDDSSFSFVTLLLRPKKKKLKQSDPSDAEELCRVFIQPRVWRACMSLLRNSFLCLQDGSQVGSQKPCQS